MPFATIAGARIHYLLEGPASLHVLMFSNSLGTNFSMWDPQAREFNKHSRILRYDTRGHGQSSVTPGPYSIEQLGKDVIALLDALQLDRVHFCALSMGGMIGMWLGANAPERLSQVILCSTAAKIGTPETWNARIDAVRKGGMKQVASSVVERWFSPAFREKVPGTVASVQRVLEEADAEGYAACCAAVRDFDFRDQLERVGKPVLVISGTHDPATPPADGRYLADHIRAARYAELNAAHLCNIEDPTRFNSEVSAFLRS